VVYETPRSNDSGNFGQLAVDSKRETTAVNGLVYVVITSWIYGTARIAQEQQDTKCDILNESYVLTLCFYVLTSLVSSKDMCRALFGVVFVLCDVTPLFSLFT